MKTLKQLFAILIISNTIWAQTAEEAVGFIENEAGFGIKAAGMGNAFSGLADDYSAIYWNPAGLAQLDYGQISGSLSHSNYDNKTTYLNTYSSDFRSFTKLQSLGVTYPFPVARGSFVIAFGYQKINNPDAFAEFSEVYFDQDSNLPFSENYSYFNEGEMEHWSFAAAIDLSKNFSAGLTLNFVGGSNLSTYTWKDEDFEDNFTYSYFERSANTTNDYSGFNAKLGGLFKLSEQLKLGATIAFPNSITVDQEWSTDEYDAYDDFQDSTLNESGTFDFLIKIPFKFSLGLSYSNQMFTLSSSVDYTDWSQLKYDVPSNRNSSEYTELLAENSFIRDNYRSVLSYSFGGEFDVLKTGLKVRGGYQYKPNPLKSMDSGFDKKFYSLGLGYDVDKRTTIEFSYTQGNWKQEKDWGKESYYLFGDGVISTEDIETQKFLFGLKYHF